MPNRSHQLDNEADITCDHNLMLSSENSVQHFEEYLQNYRMVGSTIGSNDTAKCRSNSLAVDVCELNINIPVADDGSEECKELFERIRSDKVRQLWSDISNSLFGSTSEKTNSPTCGLTEDVSVRVSPGQESFHNALNQTQRLRTSTPNELNNSQDASDRDSKTTCVGSDKSDLSDDRSTKNRFNDTWTSEDDAYLNSEYANNHPCKDVDKKSDTGLKAIERKAWPCLSSTDDKESGSQTASQCTSFSSSVQTHE